MCKMRNIEAEAGQRAVNFWTDELKSCQSPDLVASWALVQLKGPQGDLEPPPPISLVGSWFTVPHPRVITFNKSSSRCLLDLQVETFAGPSELPAWNLGEMGI